MKPTRYLYEHNSFTYMYVHICIHILLAHKYVSAYFFNINPICTNDIFVYIIYTELEKKSKLPVAFNSTLILYLKFYEHRRKMRLRAAVLEEHSRIFGGLPSDVTVL